MSTNLGLKNCYWDFENEPWKGEYFTKHKSPRNPNRKRKKPKTKSTRNQHSYLRSQRIKLRLQWIPPETLKNSIILTHSSLYSLNHPLPLLTTNWRSQREEKNGFPVGRVNVPITGRECTRGDRCESQQTERRRTRLGYQKHRPPERYRGGSRSFIWDRQEEFSSLFSLRGNSSLWHL